MPLSFTTEEMIQRNRHQSGKSEGVRHTLTITSDGSGDVDEELPALNGFLVGLEIVPAGGGSAPTDGWDLELRPVGREVDRLNGLGADLSDTTPTFLPNDGRPHLGSYYGSFRLVASNMGATKGATVVMEVQYP